MTADPVKPCTVAGCNQYLLGYLYCYNSVTKCEHYRFCENCSVGCKTPGMVGKLNCPDWKPAE